ncbi:MAG: flagellar hook-basal body complex protein [Acidobacteriia bacterium]|nr:flagellar hook-basal body complex protein [Terriglobia bacterium]
MPTFSIPLSGLTAMSTALSAIANNLANLNTVGYKDTRTLFRDLFYQTIGSSGSGDPVQLGAGVGVSSMPGLFTQGNVDPTGVATDVAINVLIYFDGLSKRRVIQHFYNNLLAHGYLFLGHSESLYGISEDFRLVHLPSATAYVKSDKRQVNR